MRKVIRKISAAIVATTITVAMCATCFAGTTFEGYFGQRENWYEGADGSLSGTTASSFSADMDAIGWGGVWGAQAHRDITVKKGQKYTLSFKATTTTAEKWVFFKVTDSQDTVVYADWFCHSRAQKKTTRQHLKHLLMQHSFIMEWVENLVTEQKNRVIFMHSQKYFLMMLIQVLVHQ